MKMNSSEIVRQTRNVKYNNVNGKILNYQK